MKRYYSIEILRFLSAITVLLYHYRHFFYPYNSLNEIDYTLVQLTLPFSTILGILYEKGFYGVHLFYTISGFVFTHIYCTSDKNTSLKNFFLNRFARLYPLHFITLILVAFLQIINSFYFNEYQIFKFNDLYHFVLQIFFISSWGFENGHSFNGPIWSVSIEVAIYIVFFFLIGFLKKYKTYFLIILSILLIFVSKLIDSENLFLQCARLFFSGSLIYFISLSKRYDGYLIILSLLLTLLSFYGNFKIYLFCPSILLLLALSEKYLHSDNLKKNFLKLGNMTYSIYLLHIPLQLILLILFNLFEIDKNIFTNNLFLISFILVLLFFSNMCFEFFEKPLNKFIRRKFK